LQIIAIHPNLESATRPTRKGWVITYGWYRHRYHYGWRHNRYYYGWNPAAAVAGTALGLATFPFAVATGGWPYYGYPYYG
jgi:hypothetical protein